MVFGDAADLNTLKKAGIGCAPSIIITTGDDDVNIYLTIYCRKLRADIQIISRAKHERNISKLHRAGADLVMSYTNADRVSSNQRQLKIDVLCTVA